MNVFEVELNEKERAYINLLANHMNQFKALLTDLAGQIQTSSMPAGVLLTRELALANTRMEEAYYHAREHVIRHTSKRNKVN